MPNLAPSLIAATCSMLAGWLAIDWEVQRRPWLALLSYGDEGCNLVDVVETDLAKDEVPLESEPTDQ